MIPDIETIRLKYIASIEMGQSPPSSEYSEFPESGLPFLQGTADFGNVSPNPQVYCAASSKVAKPNDILFSVRAPVGELNIADQEYGIGRGLCAIRCGTNLYRRFAWWSLHWVREQLALEATGSTYEAVTVDAVANLQIPFLPLDKQHKIANFLDNEITQIDKLIDVKEKLLNLLGEKRRGLISHAVLRGVRTNSPLKNSRVEWLGHIPSHWNVELARWLFTEVDERSKNGSEELLTVSHLTGVTPRSEKDVNMFMAESLEGYKKCKSGDLVLNTLWAWMGAMGVSFQEGIVSPAYNVYRPLGQFNFKYLDYLVRIPVFAQEVTRFSKGVWSSRLRLYPEHFFSVILPVPPFGEQEAIVRFLDQEIEKIDALGKITKDSITLLRERRVAMIINAISGQIDI